MSIVRTLSRLLGAAPSMTWTVDANGAYVRWTEAPYRQSDSIIRLVLTGEDPGSLPRAVRYKRIAEYMKLVRAGR
jgi:hypothetical protein